ncbi:MAG: sugar phosphate isomerase/epimerase [Puniceicoccaceae bacterium]|nr:MAG: sugar phosphate isomerase/epimerase [Puniceicoccaceae bacterium]
MTVSKSPFTLSGFADEIGPDLALQIETLRACGVGHVDLRGVWGVNVLDFSPEQVATLQRTFADEGITVSCIGSPIGKVDALADSLEAHRERFETTLRRCGEFGTRFIRIFSFHHRGHPPEAVRETVFREMEWMVGRAAEEDVVLLHENEKGIYGDTPARCRELLDRFGSPHFRGIFDPANFVQCGVDPLGEAWPVLRTSTDWFHIKDALKETGRVVLAGEGDGGIEAILRDAVARGFRGMLTLEPHLGSLKELDGPGRFRVAVEALRRVLARIGAES